MTHPSTFSPKLAASKSASAHAPLVLMTGASGAGKTTIALGVEKRTPEVLVLRADAILGVPNAEELAARYGTGPDAGSLWQREVTFQWIERIVPIVASGRPVLLDLQTRIAFLVDALAAHRIENARIVLVECDDATRTQRLIHERRQPELANPEMENWARYLHQEALESGCEILDTGVLSLNASVAFVLSRLNP
jgi:dephospho-CoA kinase